MKPKREGADYDVLIIGGGQAGIPLAHALAAKGWRVALAERKNLGGSCVNFGCTPTKAVIASARVAQLARRAFEFGLEIPAVGVDFPAVLDRARGILLQSRAALREGLEHSENPRLLRGHARLGGRHGKGFALLVGEATVTARQVVLDTGTRSRIPDIKGIHEIDFLHAGNWIDRPTLPEHLAIIGAGSTGLEMAQFYRRMGSRVSVIERGERITEKEDDEVAGALQRMLEAEEIEIHLNARVSRVKKVGSGILAAVRENRRTWDLPASHVFLAAGRRPNTDDLGLETLGVRTDKDGFLVCDGRLSTNVKGIWGAGDIRGGPMFTHTSWDDHRVLLSQLAGDGSRTTDRIVPYAIYTDPQLGRVGMTETEARRTGRKIRVGRFEMRKNGKAREIGEPDGFIKVIVDARTDRILGASVLSAEGAEIVHLYVDVMNAGGRSAAIRDAIHIHPTLSEAVQSAVTALV